MPRQLRVRGVVEGFYGKPWSHETRLDVISFVAERSMNAYLYAPKDDPKHRRRWREPYDAEEQARLAGLARHCEGAGVRFGFAISPGLDIDYSSPDDRHVLMAKLRPLLDVGVSWFLLALDDIPLADGLANRQAALASWLLDALAELRSDVTLDLCPTEYVGTRPSGYLAALGAGLPAQVGVMWTGPTVCSPHITAAQAAAWAAALGGRPPLIWDNYPVNDGPMAPALHLGPYRGRDPGLADVAAGVLCNPMEQAHASKIALATAAEFLAEPDGYDADAAWERAIEAVGGARAAPLRALARACASSALCRPEDMPATRLVDAIKIAGDAQGRSRALESLQAELTPERDVVAGLQPATPDSGGAPRADCADPLLAELAPWAEAAAREAVVGLCAVDLLRMLEAAPAEPVSSIAEPLLHAAFLLIFLWGDARGKADRIVFGPRFGVHPAIVPLPDGSPCLDLRLSVTEDANAIDRLCRLALRAYEHWTEAMSTGAQ